MSEELEWPESVDPHMLEWRAVVPSLFTRFKADAGNLMMRRRFSHPGQVEFTGIGELNASDAETLMEFLKRANGAVFAMRCPVSGVRARFAFGGNCEHSGSVKGKTINITVHIARIYEGENQ